MASADKLIFFENFPKQDDEHEKFRKKNQAEISLFVQDGFVLFDKT